MVKFLIPGFLHKFTKNKLRDIKMGYIDASRRQLQYVLKFRVYFYRGFECNGARACVSDFEKVANLFFGEVR